LLGILHRTIFLELAKVFVFSLVGITGIIVLAAIVVEASQHGLGPGQILEAIPLIVPSMLPFIVPPTTLFTTCVVFGRLSHDNEITAIKAAGVNVLFVIWPAVLLGVVMSTATLSLFLHLIPHTHLLLRTAISNDVEEFLYAMLRREHEIKGRPEMKLDYEMYCSDVQGRIIKNALFRRKDQKGNYAFIAKAREAELHVDAKNNAVIVRLRNCDIQDENGRNRGNFAENVVTVPMPEVDRRVPRSGDMEWQELRQASDGLHEDINKKQAEIALAITQRSMHDAPPTLAKHYEDLMAQLRSLQLRLNAYRTELYLRPALSFGCLFFVLVGCPVGIWLSRSDYLSSFISCFLPIVFIYYPLQLCSTNLSKDGKVTPVLALWLANAVVGVLALGLYRRLLKN
jgi:lipopolysaccharide export system permease protein